MTPTPGTFVRLAVLVIGGVVLQVAGFSTLHVFGAQPDIVPLIVGAVGLLGGSVYAACVGFSCGLLIDLALGQPVGASSLVLTAVAVVFLRNQVRPIGALAEAAEAFGKGRSVPFRPAGAEEVRRAGAAFLSMRARLERQMEQRTQMLSGVSHDLRTPLTRMKLTLELMDPSDDTRELRRDVDQM